MHILGLSYGYHDAAACLIYNGEIIAAAQEERFSRKRHDESFPQKSIEYCLEAGNIDFFDIDYIIYYENPSIKFKRNSLVGKRSIGNKLIGILGNISDGRKCLRSPLGVLNELVESGYININTAKHYKERIFFSSHHYSHAAAAFFPSGFNNSAILCMDGVGELSTTTAWIGKEESIEPLWKIEYPDSLGLLYSAFTYYCGFKVNSGEYKLMGLAPYGKPKFLNLIKNNLVETSKDGSFIMNHQLLTYSKSFKMIDREFEKLMGNKRRLPEAPISQFHKDVAASIQAFTDELVIKLARNIKEQTRCDNLCLSGGVALNCVANGKLRREGIFKNIWVQPASGDAGSAIGCALSLWAKMRKEKVTRHESSGDAMNGCYLGPEFNDQEISAYLSSVNAKYHYKKNNSIFQEVAHLISEGKVIGWFQGRMEFGPRALGHRSILGDPRNAEMQKKINVKVKFRESFRPFAPAVLEEDVDKYFATNDKSPYMLFVDNVNKRQNQTKEVKPTKMSEIDNSFSDLPAITHVDYSARIQTVSRNDSPIFYKLLKEFKNYTGCSVLINTSFNVRGEPIVCSPKDAYECFMSTNLDYLAIGNYLLCKKEQPTIELSNRKFEHD